MQEVDLSECAREPIKIPGLIQPHGVALSYDLSTHKVTGVSANFYKADTLMQKDLEEIFTSSFLATIKNLELDLENVKSQMYDIEPFVQSFEFVHLHKWDLVWSRSNNEAILELLPLSIDTMVVDCKSFLSESYIHMAAIKEIETLCEYACHEIVKSTGYDRAMIYRFDEEYNGSVIAELKKETMDSYLHLHFPSSDIPSQARELYKTQRVRSIVDVNYTPVEFIRNSSYAPLDMTYSTLRSVSPIHIEYLKNMGVFATLTISIIVNDKLWGLIACHHNTAHNLPLRVLDFTYAFGVIFSGVLQNIIDMQEQKHSVYLLSTLEAITRGIQLEKHFDITLLSVVKQRAQLFKTLFDSNGFALILENELFKVDTNCTNKELLLLLKELKVNIRNGFFATSQLQSTNPKLPNRILSEAAGVLIIKIENPEPSYWIWLRKERVKTLSWGGNPYSKLSLNKDGRISPRTSFAAYKETVRYISDPWLNADISFIENFISLVGGLCEWMSSQNLVTLKEQHIRNMEDEKVEHYGELLESLVDMIEKRDAYTAGHTQRVAHYCDIIAKELGLNTQECAQLYEAAILHDIGKIVVPDSILLKPGKLSKSEYELIKTHLIAGYEILKRISYYAPLAEIMRYHHEKYDGSGYPYGMKGDDIPLASHIMIVADSIDAMTSNRIYQSRKNMDEAIEEILLYRGIWYHPDVVDATLKALTTLKDDNSISQVPITPIEKARFSYYFKDQLTGAYNESYLKMITDNLIKDLFYQYFVVVEIKNMTAYNNTHGWHAGDKYLQKVCNILLNYFEHEKIFRVFGDDFIVACDTQISANEALEVLKKDGLKDIDFYIVEIHALQGMLLK